MPPFDLLDRSVHSTLETYSNVHRGSGVFSQLTTDLFEQARGVAGGFLGAGRDEVVLFCTPRRAERVTALAGSSNCKSISSDEIGLPLGVTALSVKRSALPKGVPPESGGGTARLMAPGWVVWEKAPDRFEAGTPAIVNIIAFARSLQLTEKYGPDAFRNGEMQNLEEVFGTPFPGLSGKALLNALRQEWIGKETAVPTVSGDRPFIYFDNAASTPTLTPVWDTFRKAMRLEESGRAAVIREAGSRISSFLNAPTAEYDLIFTSNTTEAINLAAESLRRSLPAGITPVILGTMLEHSSNDLPWRTKPFVFERLSIDTEGFIDPAELEKKLQSYNTNREHGDRHIALVTVTGASNVLGTYNDLEAIGRIVHANGAKLLVDAAQMVAHRSIDMSGWEIDYLAFSGHKAYAPFGSGALVAKKSLVAVFSGETEFIRRSGEANAAGIAALGTAVELLQRTGMESIREEESALTARLLSGLSEISGLTLYGITDPASPRFSRKGGVVAFALKGRMSDKVSKDLALRGIGTRFGCHCSHILVKKLVGISPFLEKVQKLIVTVFPKIQLPGVARISLGIENSGAEVDALLAALKDIAGKKLLPKDEVKGKQEALMERRKKIVFD